MIRLKNKVSLMIAGNNTFNFENILQEEVEKENFKLLGTSIEKTNYLNGTQKYGFQFLAWFCVFIKNKPYSKLTNQQITISVATMIENKKKKRITLQDIFKRTLFSKRGFLFAKFKEVVVKDVPHEGELVNIYIESRIISILGYALLLRPKRLIFKALDLQALPATRKNNPNKTDVYVS